MRHHRILRNPRSKRRHTKWRQTPFTKGDTHKVWTCWHKKQLWALTQPLKQRKHPYQVAPATYRENKLCFVSWQEITELSPEDFAFVQAHFETWMMQELL